MVCDKTKLCGNSSTAARFDQVYSKFANFCEPIHRIDVKQYFDKNWKTCLPMWANFERSKRFSAGNTTTNRIESNWNQLKMILRKRTSIDKTVSALLQYQAYVLDQIARGFVSSTRSSRSPATVPTILRRISGVMSNFTLAKVRRWWDIYIIHGANMALAPVQSSCDWEVHSNGRRFICNDAKWTCSCWFYTTYHLPCEHIMAVVKKGKGFDELPVLALAKRWNMVDASQLYGVFDKSATAIHDAVNVLQLSKHCEEKAPLDYENAPSMNETADYSGAASSDDTN